MAAETTFGDWLRRRRQELGLTRDECARLVGCSTVTLRKLEAEERRPSKPMADRIAEVLKIPPADRPAFLRFARGDPYAAPAGLARLEKAESSSAPPHNLPLQLTSFIGREQEVVDIHRLLTPAPGWRTSALEGVRLLTLTGVGGAGKTRLALQAAAGLLAEFSDGVWLVELAPLSDPLLVPQAAGSVLGLREMPGQPILVVLVGHLRPKRLLLVLDNCEHIVHACAELAETLLRACPNLTILATSREGLGVAGETTRQVPPLSLPTLDRLGSAEMVTQSEAVQLFAERARAALPGFSITGNNSQAVAQVCRQLDGIPLAIELAAARVKFMQVKDIAARLNDRFGLLTGGSRTALPRHQTLQALIDWSYALLPAPERRLLQRLAVFVAGWILAAAEAVGVGEGVAESEVFDRLTQLANKSLVVVERQPGQAVRYRMLETIREYVLAKLAASGEMDAVWRRLAEYYFDLAQARRSTDSLEGDLDYSRRMEPEIDNLRAVLTWSRSAVGTTELGLRLAGAVMPVWIGRGFWNEARGFLEGALAGADAPAAGETQARVYYELGAVAWFQGDYAVAPTHLIQSLTLSRDGNDRLASAWTLARLGELTLEQGDAAGAALQLEESLKLFRELGIKEGIAFVARDLGMVAIEEEQAAHATPLLEESLALYRALEMPMAIGWVYHHLGATAQLQGDYTRARQLHDESLSWFRQHGEPNMGQPWAYYGLGYAALAQDDTADAGAHIYRALTLFRDEGDRSGISFCLAGLAGVAALDEAPQRAARLWGAAEALRQSIGARQAPATRVTRERLMATAREQLGQEAFAAAWAEGQKMTMDEAIALALPEGPARP